MVPMRDNSKDSIVTTPSLKKGMNAIADVVKTLTNGPGVYRMYDGLHNVLYVGKAKNLKRRVVNYSRPHKLPVRMVAHDIRRYGNKYYFFDLEIGS